MIFSSGMLLYRTARSLEPWLGFGSYWAEDPEVARAYGSGRHMYRTTANLKGKRLSATDDYDLAIQLTNIGVPSADDVIGELDWFELEPVRAAFESNKINWIVKPIDPSVSIAVKEWIYVGSGTVPAELVHGFEPTR